MFLLSGKHLGKWTKNKFSCYLLLIRIPIGSSQFKSIDVSSVVEHQAGFLPSSVSEQTRIPGSCLVAVALCRWTGSLPSALLPFPCFPLCLLSTQTAGDAAALPLLPTVPLICV